MLYAAGVVRVSPGIFRADPCRCRQPGGFGREHTEIGNPSCDQNEDRRHQRELYSHAALMVAVSRGDFTASLAAISIGPLKHRHSATATVPMTGRFLRPAPPHPPDSSRDGASMSRVW